MVECSLRVVRNSPHSPFLFSLWSSQFHSEGADHSDRFECDAINDESVESYQSRCQLLYVGVPNSCGGVWLDDGLLLSLG